MFTNNPKYQQIIESGTNLFWKFGIKRVSVEEICNNAEVSKATFYKYFSNKVELAKAIMKIKVEGSLKEYRQLINKQCSFTDKINRMLEMKLEGTKDISHEFITDVYQNPEFGLVQDMQKYGEESFKITRQFLTDSQKNGDIRKNINIDFVMYLLNKMIDITSDKYLKSIYKTPSELIMEAMEFFFYGIGAKN